MSRVEASSRWATFKEAQDTLRPCAHAHIPKLLLCTCSPPPLTCTHRYKLLDFDPSYAQEAAPLQRKLDLCSRAAAVLAKTPSLAVEAGYEALRQADISSANAQGGAVVGCIHQGGGQGGGGLPVFAAGCLVQGEGLRRLTPYLT